MWRWITRQTSKRTGSTKERKRCGCSTIEIKRKRSSNRLLPRKKKDRDLKNAVLAIVRREIEAAKKVAEQKQKQKLMQKEKRMK